MDFVFEISQKGLDQLSSGEKIILAAALLGCATLVAYSICRLLRYSRRLQSLDSQLGKLRSNSRPV